MFRLDWKHLRWHCVEEPEQLIRRFFVATSLAFYQPERQAHRVTPSERLCQGKKECRFQRARGALEVTAAESIAIDPLALRTLMRSKALITRSRSKRQLAKAIDLVSRILRASFRASVSEAPLRKTPLRTYRSQTYSLCATSVICSAHRIEIPFSILKVDFRETRQPNFQLFLIYSCPPAFQVNITSAQAGNQRAMRTGSLQGHISTINVRIHKC